MSIDLQQLHPASCIRLLNSTSLGTVVNSRIFREIRLRAGYRIGTDTRVNLYRYTSWHCAERHHPKRRSSTERGDYDALKERSRARNARLSKSGRDIGELPPVHDPKRRERGRTDFRFFCESYYSESFHLRWSEDHLKVIAKIERAVLKGELMAFAMPRGSGKTTLCEVGAQWAVLYGHRSFIPLVGAEAKSAEEMLDRIKAELETNERLAEDFPEVCIPIQALDGIAQRANGQLYRGQRTHIEWSAQQVILPTIPGSHASGAIIRVAGITGRIRGMQHRASDGSRRRPDLVIVDDPQTDESARSLSQNQTRERILAGAILGLAGPGKKISGFMPCTVIARHDMADNILDRDKHPEWQGERMKMLYGFPTDTKLWAQYEEIRAEDLKAEKGMARANAFYREHRAEMDAGAVVAWPERKNPDDVSAVQHCMNLKFQDEAAFFAEYQNEPKDIVVESATLTADQIAAKLNRLDRGLVPIESSHLTAFIDVQEKALFWVVAGWRDGFSGSVVDYGVWPDQERAYFSLREAQRTLARMFPAAGLEGRLYSGLEKLTNEICGREWKRDDGGVIRIERCLVDANWGQSTDVVYQFCRQSAHAAVLTPSHGRYVGASSYPFSEYKKKPGDRVGHNWRIPNVRGRRATRHVLFDANFWKTFIHARLAAPEGDRGCLNLFGRKPETHRLFAEHLTAEYAVRTTARGRVVDEWKSKPNNPDNHWFDGVVGCAVAASMLGISLDQSQATVRAVRQRVSFAELQRQRQQR